MAGQSFRTVSSHVRHFFAITFFVTVDSLFTHASANNLSSTDEPASEVKYAAIGTGIGMFFALCFVAIKLYMIKRHMLDNEPSEESTRRPCAQQKK